MSIVLVTPNPLTDVAATRHLTRLATIDTHTKNVTMASLLVRPQQLLILQWLYIAIYIVFNLNWEMLLQCEEMCMHPTLSNIESFNFY